MRTRIILLSTLGAVLLLSAPASAVTIDWVPIGNPGNACDVQSQGCFGAVATDYLISKYEVTNAQYAEFLNAVADTDTNALYSPGMGSGFGGITRSGVSGSFTYSTIAGRGEMPVNNVAIYDALRFANWMHNGQPTGAQDNTTTESGAYTFSGPFSASARNSGATIFLPSEDEWYKAAYYDAVSTSYFDYPAGSDTPTTCSTPTATPNRANCNSAVGNLAVKGSYTGSASPFGTFDQGGNVSEWNEAIISGSFRGVRGGSYNGIAAGLEASFRGSFSPAIEANHIGFRVGSIIPEPGTGLLVIAGLLGIAGWRKGRD
jgi:formylglycine-generating enzyme required for sulfatase activity